MILKGGPTQDEIMVVSLFKLGLKCGDVFADIGRSTGKVAIHAARTAGKVYAIDRRIGHRVCYACGKGRRQHRVL